MRLWVPELHSCRNWRNFEIFFCLRMLYSNFFSYENFNISKADSVACMRALMMLLNFKSWNFLKKITVKIWFEIFRIGQFALTKNEMFLFYEKISFFVSANCPILKISNQISRAIFFKKLQLLKFNNIISARMHATESALSVVQSPSGCNCSRTLGSAWT